MKNTGLLILLPLLAACGGDGSSSSGGGREAVNVVWTLDPQTGPACRNNSDVTRFNSDYAQSIRCIWSCANYKGQRDVYVSLGFERRNRSGAKWVFDTEYVSTGICY